MGKIFYIMGKSAVGKDHIYGALLNRDDLNLHKMILYTTRPPRKGEKDGVEYYFTDEKKLNQLREEGKIIEERCYQTVHGPWIYFTADEGQFDLERYDYVGIGTLESFIMMKKAFGERKVCPLYIEVDDGTRYERAVQREQKQPKPDYDEMKRRFESDQRDYSEEDIKEAGIDFRFENDVLENCIDKIASFIQEQCKEA